MRKLFPLLLVDRRRRPCSPPSALAATKSVKVGDNYFVRDSGTPTVNVEEGGQGPLELRRPSAAQRDGAQRAR